MKKQTAKVNKKELEACLNCPICNKPFDHATTINECLHTFCKKCIDEKLAEKEPKTCPVCNVVIGEISPQMHSYDKTLESLKNKILSAMQKNQKMKIKTSAATQNSNSNSNSNPTDVSIVREKSVVESNENIAKTSCDKLKKGKEKVKGSEVLIGPKRGKKSIDKLKKKKVDEIVNVEDNNKIARRSGPIWFTLLAANNQDVNACLPQITNNYLMVEDTNVSVLFIKNYIANAMKLELVNETEIEIFLKDQPLDSTKPLHSLIDLWVETTSVSETKDSLVGSSAQDFVIILTYGRKI